MSGDGSIVYDTFGDNDGTWSGTAAYTNGVRGDAASFDGVDNYIDIGISHSDTDDGFSYSIWIRSEQSERFDPLGGADNTKANTPMLGYTINNDFIHAETVRVAFWARGASGGRYHVAYDQFINDGNWWHLVTTVDSESNMILYVNGELVDERETSINRNINLSDSFGIGVSKHHGNPSHFTNGSIDEVAIWNRALTSNEVSEIYNNGAGLFYTP